MNNLHENLEPAEEKNEEIQCEKNDKQTHSDLVDKTNGGDAVYKPAKENKGACESSAVVSLEEKNSCECRVCDFVAKTPTALKIHCKRKHRSRTPFTVQSSTSLLPEVHSIPTDQPNTILPSTDQPSTTPSRTDQPSTTPPPTESTTDQSEITPPSPTGHLSTTLPPNDHPSTETLERLHCRCCSFYSCTVEDMNAHLSGEAHQKCAREKNMEPLFEQCVEKVLVILLNEEKGEGDQSECDGNVSKADGKGVQEDVGESVGGGVNDGADEGQSPDQTVTAVSMKGNVPLKRKRGRPRSSQVTSCSHCGLVASNPTNLSVHVRRKHSRLYSFHCRVCKYSCVTKGDMDRHCETKKHIKRVQSDGGKQDAIVLLNAEQGSHGTVGEKAQDPAEQEAPAIKEEGEMGEETGCDIPSKKSRYDFGKSCAHCEFVAHSALSLDLHIRRKHTKNFEFVCLACSYYAVTRKEMSRHTATEKHKHKRLRYLQKRQKNTQEPNDGEADTDCTETVNADSENAQNNRGEEEATSNPRLSENTNGTKEALEVTDPADTVVTPLEKQEEENNEDDYEEDDNEDMMTAESPSDETPLFQTAQFDECVFSLKVQTEDGNTAEMTKPLAKMLGPSEGREQEGNTRVRCDDCGFLAEGLGGLNVHITMKHPTKEKRFHCLLCGKSFYSDSNLQQHLSSSTHLRTEHGSVDERPDGGSAFRCVRCNEPCASEQDLFVHIKEKHEELLREVNKYVLEDTEQINRERQENPGNVCKYCGKVCKSSNSIAFLAHIRTHTGSKPFMCKICNFATAQLGDARTHVKRHLGMREYKCHLCGWAFVMKKHLNTHLLGKHGLGQPKDRKYECELCDRTFIEKWALNNHMKLHTGEKPFKCTWLSCHYAFLTLSAMKDHYRTHTGEKSFLCDLCGFAGGTRHALTKHRRQHTGERPFRCELCSFASTTQSHLTRHKRVHTGEKPYRCPWCDYRSNCAENIRKHILHTGKHEGVMMYNCPRCDYCTNTPSEFRNHLKDEHRDIENPDLAYLHAGIVSKSFECRLKGQGSTYVETDTPFTPDEGHLGAETLQQVIIIQGYGEEAELQGAEQEKAALEESVAATLQTLAMSSSVNAELLQVTQDGRVVPYTHKNYMVVESGVGQTVQGVGQASQTMDQENIGPSTALDALLCAVTELDQQGGAAQPEGSSTTEQQSEDQEEGQEAVQVYEEVVQVLGHAHQEVLQFAASQLLMNEGLTQVIVNDEGTHYIVTEVTDPALQVDGTVYTQTVEVDSRQEAGLCQETESKAAVTYSASVVIQDD